MSTGQYHFSVWIINLPILNNTGIYLCCSILQNQLGCYLRAQLWYLLILGGLSWTLKQSNQERIRWEGRGEANICPRLSQWGREEQIVSKFHIHDLGHWRRFQVCFHSIHFFYLWKTRHCLLISGYFIGKIPAIPCVHGSRTSSHRLIWPHKVSRLTWTTNSVCHPSTKSCSIIKICCPPSINKWGRE